MSRTIVDLDARATVLEAAEKVANATATGDIALVVAPGAPLLRSSVFLDVLRGLTGPRRLSLVTTDARARSVASSAHVPAYASLAALERHELDPTERLTPARRAAIASVRSGEPREVTTGKVLAALGSVAAAAMVLLAVVLPEATVRVAATVQPVGPVELEVRAGGGGEIAVERLTAQFTVRIPIVATGERITETRGKGSVQLQNKTTSSVAIPRGSIFSTADGVQFLSTEDRTLPRSVIVPGINVTLNIGRVDVPVEAAVAGDPGNVAAGTIVNGPQPDRYTVSNDRATSGGEIVRAPVMRAEDYDAAVAKVPEALQAEGDRFLQERIATPPLREGRPLQVVQQVLVAQESLGPARVDVVGREEAGIEMTVTGTATVYAVSGEDFRREVLEALEADQVPPGRDIADGSELIEVLSVTATPDGVTWRVLVSAAHQNRASSAAVSRLLAGRPAGEAQAILAAQDLRLEGLERAPSWWPFMPLLDGRIEVRIEGTPVTQGR
ncbi:MAG: baseplate J/gp47 family protein [Candidatus Limnocylindria bacterium]